MANYELPAVGGRRLLIRSCGDERPQVMVGLVSTRGNIMEAVTIEAGDVLGLCRALGRIGRQSFNEFERRQREERRAARRRYREGIARNPWLTLSPEELKRKRLV